MNIPNGKFVVCSRPDESFVGWCANIKVHDSHTNLKDAEEKAKFMALGNPSRTYFVLAVKAAFEYIKPTIELGLTKVDL